MPGKSPRDNESPDNPDPVPQTSLGSASGTGELPPRHPGAGRVPGKAAFLKEITARTWRSAVLWSWGFNGLRFGSVLLLLPLLLRLPENDLGFYYFLLHILAITPLIDFGFGLAVERSVSYGMGGARELRPHGAPPATGAAGQPNWELLWKLLYAARLYYRWLSLLLIAALSTAGTFIVWQAIGQTTNPAWSWLAWGVAVFGAGFEVYASWWNVYLRGMNQVVTCNRILVLAYGIKLIVSCGLLLLGFGLVSVFAAGLLSSMVVRALSRRKCLALLGTPRPRPARPELLRMFWTLWPNSWRVGLQIMSNYATALSLSFLCFHHFQLSGNAQYGLSIQVVTVIQAMAMVWVHVKWPQIGQLRSRGDYAGMRRILRPRIWLAIGTYSLLAVLALALGPLLLEWSNTGKELLPAPWLLILLLHGLFETHVIIWGTFLTTENKVPTLWPVVLTNIMIVGLAVILTQITTLGIGVLALAALLPGCLFNNWFWPLHGARNLGTTWLRYMFGRENQGVRFQVPASAA